MARQEQVAELATMGTVPQPPGEVSRGRPVMEAEFDQESRSPDKVHSDETGLRLRWSLQFKIRSRDEHPGHYTAQ